MVKKGCYDIATRFGGRNYQPIGIERKCKAMRSMVHSKL